MASSDVRISADTVTDLSASASTSLTARIPTHLRKLVVAQDYAAYTAVDQAVWRFVLLQTYGRLIETAHPTYRDGLAATGMSVDRIPRIEAMNESLNRFGWAAVAVDGFVPPRAFQEFQAAGILPIAAEIRTREHLAYTPAPDIIHEAAGHAPILPEPTYAAYLRRIGELGAQAFTLPVDERIFQAVYALSEIKEDRNGNAAAVARAEQALTDAIAAAPEASEAARLSRLYWWTAEYGLVGRPDDYRIYGAGLLSSLGESHSCHTPEVTKRPLDETCMDVSYDITRPQPQLFVARSFEALHDVVERAAHTLAVARGGAFALERALASRETASVLFTSGTWIIGTLSDAGPRLDTPAWLAFDAARQVAVAPGGRLQMTLPEAAAAADVEPVARHVVVTGRLGDGRALDHLTDADVEHLRASPGGAHRFDFASSARVDGRLDLALRAEDGRLVALALHDVRLALPGRPPMHLDRYLLPVLGDVVTARAGAIDGRFHADTEARSAADARVGAPALQAVATARPGVPRPRVLPARERQLLDLYEQAEHAHHASGDAVTPAFSRVHAALTRDFPDEWLLRWNLLESLLKARADPQRTRNGGDAPGLVDTLRSELERLELAFDRRQPIASGLRALAR